MPPPPLHLRPWPTERETIEQAIDAERGGTVEERILRAAALYGLSRALSRGPDPYGERLEAEGNEELRRWIEAHRSVAR
jgi:hypothetical protein